MFLCHIFEAGRPACEEVVVVPPIFSLWYLLLLPLPRLRFLPPWYLISAVAATVVFAVLWWILAVSQFRLGDLVVLVDPASSAFLVRHLTLEALHGAKFEGQNCLRLNDLGVPLTGGPCSPCIPPSPWNRKVKTRVRICWWAWALTIPKWQRCGRNCLSAKNLTGSPFGPEGPSGPCKNLTLLSQQMFSKIALWPGQAKM